MFFLVMVVYGSTMFPVTQEAAAKYLLKGLKVICFYTYANVYCLFCTFNTQLWEFILCFTERKSWSEDKADL